MTGSRLHELADRWLLDLAGEDINQLRIDYAFSICCLVEDGEYCFRIEHPFSFHADETEYVVEPDDLSTVCPALQLHMQTIERVEMHKDGRLSIACSASRVEVGAGERYESWQLTGPDHILFVSVPGGSLAIWLPQSGD